MACESDDATYISTLDEASRKKAKEELLELNDTDRAIAVQTLRKWVNEEDWLTSPTDFGFLLRFIRARKFSQLGARQTLENYWTCRTKLPEWFKDVDPADEGIQAVLKSGVISSPMKCDNQGRRLVIMKLGNMDAHMQQQWGNDLFFRAMWLVYDWVVYDENVQVNGFCIFSDWTDMSVRVLMQIWTPPIAKKFIQYFTKCLPARIRGIHNYKEPTFMDIVTSLSFPLFSKKIVNRFLMHGSSMVNIYDHIGKEVLPKEYIPDDYKGSCVGTCSEIVDAMIADMQTDKFRNYIKDLSCDKYGVDISMRKQDTGSEDASFRKIVSE